MNRLILVIFFALILPGCGNESTSEPPLPEDVKYTISEDTHKRNIKRSVVVILEDKASKDILNRIAHKIKKTDSTKYQRTFISYYLKGKDRNNGYWATTYFNPNLEVRFLGLSKEDEAALAKPVVSTPNKDVIGVWLDDRPGVGAKMTLYYSNEGELFLESTYSDGSSGTKEMIEFALENGKRIEDKEGNDFGEYFVINKANQLEFWSKNGNYYTAKIIQ